MEIQVLRLETDSRRGVYRRCYGTACAHSRGANDPSPREDNIPDLQSSEYCGFESAEQMRKWFRNRKHDLRLFEQGVQVSTYIVDESHVRKGNCQLVFKLDEAERVDRQPLHCYP